MRFQQFLGLAFAALITLLLTGCGPEYPNCDGDDDCQAQGEFCVDKKCRECRTDNNCDGVCSACRGGTCDRKPGCCTGDVDCTADAPKCGNDNRCYQCLADSDCEPGYRCRDNACYKPECLTDADCADRGVGYTCQNERCIPPTLCQMNVILFDFDEHKIRRDQENNLSQINTCYEERKNFKGEGGSVNLKLTGHCDERGTEEYNLSLGEKRSKSVFNKLKSMGIPKGQMTTDSRGEYDPVVRNASSESEHQRNRRVVTTPN